MVLSIEKIPLQTFLNVPAESVSVFFGNVEVHPVRNSSPAIVGLETERGIISNGVNVREGLTTWKNVYSH
jgi:hypothetical protein